MPAHLLFYLWKSDPSNRLNLWQALLRCLQEVSFTSSNNGETNESSLDLITEAPYIPNNGEDGQEDEADNDFDANGSYEHRKFYLLYCICGIVIFLDA
jgi:hypothetical protein